MTLRSSQQMVIASMMSGDCECSSMLRLVVMSEIMTMCVPRYQEAGPSLTALSAT